MNTEHVCSFDVDECQLTHVDEKSRERDGDRMGRRRIPLISEKRNGVEKERKTDHVSCLPTVVVIVVVF